LITDIHQSSIFIFYSWKGEKMNLLEDLLSLYNKSIKDFHRKSLIPESTLRLLNKKEFNRWTINQINDVAEFLEEDKIYIIKLLESIECKNRTEGKVGDKVSLNFFNLENRRYIGSKLKLIKWIRSLIETHTEGKSFFDVFAGTGIVAQEMMSHYERIIINDFLYSNNVIYHGFFDSNDIDICKMQNISDRFNDTNSNFLDENYFSNNYGGKFFSNNDAKKIGWIRDELDINKTLSCKEKNFLLTSLLYSIDKVANTVGHYDAYRKNIDIPNRFEFKLIQPIDTKSKSIDIYRCDANQLVSNINTDIVFLDPPYNSRQYSRFYHLLENVTKWEKPKLSGVAMKPPEENMSLYCKVDAPHQFDSLVKSLNAKYIVTTYNNTYNSKSSSSKNKITHSEILTSLNSVGTTKIFESDHKFFNAGKTDLKGHKEFVFITEVNREAKA
jgi:adenine-specific DNA methylase